MQERFEAVKCPSCNKFAAYDSSAEPDFDVEVSAYDNENDGAQQSVTLTGTIRVVLTSECCSDELKEYNFEIDIQDVDIVKHAECTCVVFPPADPEVLEVYGGGSWDESKKGVYELDATLTVLCQCRQQVGEAKFKEAVKASEMDEL